MIECSAKILVLLSCIFQVSCTPVTDRYRYLRYLDVQGYKCSDSQMSEVPGSSNVGACARECSTFQSCVLFSYNRVSKLCQIHNHIISNSSCNCTQDEDTDHYILDKVCQSNTLPIIERELEGVPLRSYFGNNALTRILEEGEIIQWQFFSVAVGEAQLQVWRPRGDLGDDRYEFVGQNHLMSTVIGQSDTLKVAEHERIQVQPGDVIGIYYEAIPAGITYSECEAADSPTAAQMSWIDVADASLFVSGKIYTHATQDSCQIFSLKAILGPKRTNSMSQVNSLPITSRSSVGSLEKVYIGLNSNFRIRVDGQVSIWKFYSKFSGNLALQVWRHINNTSTQQISFVGQNIVKTVHDGPQVVYVNETDRIQVTSGDYIAVYYGQSKGGLCYDTCDKSVNVEADPVARSADSIESSEDFYDGMVLDLMFPHDTCRVFSLTAFIQPNVDMIDM
ncbi:uncharacterized protein [Haliotis asinina]|uniref:uncharacterized protein n=1 Tax=Haliotis asinina TaxID=109174 RepID=UPI003531C29A